MLKKSILLFSIITLIFGSFVIYSYFFPVKTYFSCHFKTNKEHINFPEEVYITVNKYFGGFKYTLNEYELNECFYFKQATFHSADTVNCHREKTSERPKMNLSFNVIEGFIDSIFYEGDYYFLYKEEQFCQKIVKAVD